MEDDDHILSHPEHVQKKYWLVGADGAVGFCVRGFPKRGPPPLGQVAGSTPMPPIKFPNAGH